MKCTKHLDIAKQGTKLLLSLIKVYYAELSFLVYVKVQQGLFKTERVHKSRCLQHFQDIYGTHYLSFVFSACLFFWRRKVEELWSLRHLHCQCWCHQRRCHNVWKVKVITDKHWHYCLMCSCVSFGLHNTGHICCSGYNVCNCLRYVYQQEFFVW